MVACGISSILGKVRAAVPRQRHHGDTARECEDEDECHDKCLHGWPPLTAEAAMAERAMGDSGKFVFVLRLKPR